MSDDTIEPQAVALHKAIARAVKAEAEVYRMMVVNQDLREWWSASSSAMRDKRREHLMRST
jgi:dsDNA-binding SOS-regulon protein